MKCGIGGQASGKKSGGTVVYGERQMGKEGCREGQLLKIATFA